MGKPARGDDFPFKAGDRYRQYYFSEKVEIGEEMTAGELLDDCGERGGLVAENRAGDGGRGLSVDRPVWIAAGARSGTRSEDIQRRHENPLERETGNHL